MSTITMPKQMLTPRGLFWLKLDIVSYFGNDKILFEQLDEFFDANIDEWKAKFMDTEWILKNTDEPKLFQVAVYNYIMHENGLPVSGLKYVDCSNQALQLYAILTGDLSTARVCNIGDVPHQRIDGYQILADKLNNLIGEEDVLLREHTKKPLMTTLYGKQSAWDVLVPILEKHFGSEVDTTELSKLFEDALYSIAPKAMEAMAKIQMLNSEHIPIYRWTLPDGFNVKYDVKSENEITAERTSKAGHRFHYTGFVTEYKPSKNNAGMAPNLIHSIDGYIARRIILGLDFFVHTIHDAYGCHYNQVDELIGLWKDIMCEILDSELLYEIMEQIADGRKYKHIKKYKTLLREHILNSIYGLC